MLNEKQRALIKYILAEKSITKMIDLEVNLNYSEKTIREAIKNINVQFNLISYNRDKGFFIEEKKQLAAIGILEEDNANNRFPQTPKERQYYMVALLLTSTKPLSLQFFSDLFFVAKTTVKNDMTKAIDWLEQQEVLIEKGSKGHLVALPLEQRKLLIISLITKHFNSPSKAQKLLEFIFEDDLHYNFIANTVIADLVKFGIHTSDLNMVYFVNYIVLSQKMHTPSGALTEEEENSEENPIFQQLVHELKEAVLIDERDWQLIEKLFNSLILGISAHEDYLLAKGIVDDFLQISLNDYCLSFQEDDKEELLNIIASFIRDHRLFIEKNTKITSEIMKMYTYAYEIARIFVFLFESNNIKINREELALLSLYINTLLVREEERKIDLILICDLDSIVEQHILTALLRTTNQSFVQISSMTLYEFHSRVEHLDPDATILLDTGNNAQRTSNEANFVYLNINPIFLRKDIEEINHLIVQTNIIRRNKRKEQAVLNCQRVISFLEVSSEQAVELLSEAKIKYQTFLGRGLLIIKTLNRMNFLTCVSLKNSMLFKDEIVSTIIFYSINPDQKAEATDILMVESTITKYLDSAGINACHSTGEFIELLRESSHME